MVATVQQVRYPRTSVAAIEFRNALWKARIASSKMKELVRSKRLTGPGELAAVKL